MKIPQKKFSHGIIFEGFLTWVWDEEVFIPVRGNQAMFLLQFDEFLKKDHKKIARALKKFIKNSGRRRI